MHVADKALVLGEACVQQPCIHPRLLDVPGTSSIGHVGLVFSKTKPTQDALSKAGGLFQNQILLDTSFLQQLIS